MDFQGFQNSIPEIFIVLIAGLLLLLSFLSYKKHKSIPPVYRFLLAGLRALALILLFLMLLNPFFRNISERQIMPRIAVFMDNSESISIEKGMYEGVQSYKDALNSFTAEKPANAELVYYSFASDVQASHPDSLSFDKGATNPDELVQYILDSEGYEAAVMFSDGIITLGKNPVVAAGSSPVPIYTIALGDTSRVRDISIRNIVTNSTGFTHTSHPVKAEISQYGYDNNEITVSLSEGEKVLDTRQVRLRKDQPVTEVEFDIELSEKGLRLYEINAEPVAGEWNTDNNKMSFTIDVLEGKTRIHQFASVIHPDVKALRAVLATDENIEIETYTLLSKWVPEPDWNSIKEHADLLIFHGLPDASLLEGLGAAVSETPTLQIILPPFDRYRRDEHSFVLMRPETMQATDAAIRIPAAAKNHPVLDTPDIDFDTAPPVFTPVRSTTAQPGTELLLSAVVRGVPSDLPLLGILERGNIRRSSLNMYGWYKMYQSSSAAERDFITALLSNLANWTAASPDTRLLKVRSSKNSYSVAEQPVINASLINESGSNEPNALLELELSRPDGSTETFVFKNMGGGLYRLDLPELPGGQYDYEVTAQRDSRFIEQASGTFIVTESSAELINTVRNDELLKGIAEQSSGRFYEFDKLETIWDDIRESGILAEKSVTEEYFAFPVQNPGWFIVVLILLSAEWLLRKKYSLP